MKDKDGRGILTNKDFRPGGEYILISPAEARRRKERSKNYRQDLQNLQDLII